MVCFVSFCSITTVSSLAVVETVAPTGPYTWFLTRFGILLHRERVPGQLPLPRCQSKMADTDRSNAVLRQVSIKKRHITIQKGLYSRWVPRFDLLMRDVSLYNTRLRF